jgi:tetratricopeptide (TPR) repeat protein
MRLKASIVLLVGLLCLLQPFSLMAKTQKGFDTLYTAEFDSLFLDALCAKSSGKIQESIDLYKLCNQLNPRSAIVCYELGILYLKLDSVKLGIDYINKSCDYDPENYYYQTNLANIYSKKGMYNESLKKCEFIAKKFPQNDNVFYQLSMLYTQTGQYDKALSALDKL